MRKCRAFKKGMDFQMKRVVWKAMILPGKLDEYIKRHREIWPEMTEVLNQAGIHNYSIWNIGNELFGYYECEDIDHATRVQSNSTVVEKWNEYMKDVMQMVADPRATTSLLPLQVFYHE